MVLAGRQTTPASWPPCGEGRGIYENIQKSLVYLLAGNTGELLLIAGRVRLRPPPSPLLPLQLLWINLVTDGLPALALVMDPADPELLERPPRPLQEAHPGAARQWRTILWVGTLEAALSLGGVRPGRSARGTCRTRGTWPSRWWCFAEVLRALASRSATRTYWEVRRLEQRAADRRGAGQHRPAAPHPLGCRRSTRCSTSPPCHRGRSRPPRCSASSRPRRWR